MTRLSLMLGCIASALHAQTDGDWRAYGRDAGGSRHSPLSQITRENVSQLRVAWTFSTGEKDIAARRGRPPSLQVTPLVIGGIMYVSTPVGRVFALDAATGAVKWRYDAVVDPDRGYGDFANRGVAYWEDGSAAPSAACAKRIFASTIDARVIALDAATGATCAQFGANGSIDLRAGLRIAPFEFPAYQLTSPVAVVNDIVVVGSSIADNSRPGPASGEVRAFDARTGALRWTFDPVPQDTTVAQHRASWRNGSALRTGGANVWSVIVADPGRDIVFLPTSSPAPDYYGGLRLGDNRYANSLVALQASTGKVLWHFQTVHHDLWDFDNASPPALTTVTTSRGPTAAVLQTNKSGMLFAFDRVTGVPIFPVAERPVPKTDVPGEESWPTQPVSVELWPQHPEPWGPTPNDREWCRELLSRLRYDGPFTPPSLRGTLSVPGNIGGAHWGGMAVDSARQIAVVPVNLLPAMVQLIPADRLNADSVRREDAARGITDFEYTRMRETPYVMRRRLMMGPSGVPCVAPPWGGLVGVNLRQGGVAWRVPLGDMTPADQRAPGRPPTGAPNLGGPIVTASGVVFIGATLDRMFRAFDVETGKELWSAALPAGARATPMTYAVNGKQYVAVAAGGAGPFGSSDTILVYGLP